MAKRNYENDRILKTDAIPDTSLVPAAPVRGHSRGSRPGAVWCNQEQHMKLISTVSSDHDGLGCDYALIDLSPALARLALNRVNILMAQYTLRLSIMLESQV